MDAELKAKWLEALRSGDYQQGIGKFERDGRFCCLGVLCKVAGEYTVHYRSGWGNWNFAKKALGAPRMADTLATMNDYGSSFPEIADYIEANL